MLKKFGVYFLLLWALCFLPISSDLYAYNISHVTVEPFNPKPVSIRSKVVTQKLYLEGTPSNLAIRLYAPSGQLYDNAIVSFELSQNGKIIKDEVLAKDLRIACSYMMVDTKNRIEETPREIVDYTIRPSLIGFRKGEAVLTITALNCPDGTDIFLQASESVVSGLPSATVDDNELGFPIVICYDVFKYDKHFLYETSLLLVLLSVVAFAAWLLSFGEKLQHKFPILLRAIAIATIALIVGIKNPYASFWGEPLSEAVYEFWYKAHNYSFIGNLMSLMSGEALAWLERILMWIADTLFPLKYVFVAAQLIELAWIAWVCSLPCIPFFNKFFSPVVRLGISIYFGCFLFFDSQYFFWSCSYWGIVFFVLFALCVNEEQRTFPYALYLILTVILCVSRIYNVILIPVSIVLILTLRKNNKKRLLLYCGTVAIASAFEVVYSLSRKDNLSSGSNAIVMLKEIGVVRIICNTIYYQVQVINSMFFGNVHFQGFGINMLGIAVIIAFIIVVIIAVKKKNTKAALFYACLGFISFSSIAINVFVSGSHYEVAFPLNYSTRVDWTQNIYQQADLHFSYSYFCFFTMLLGILYQTADRVRIWVKNSIRLRKSYIISVMILLIVLASVSAKERKDYDYIPVSWKDVYRVVEKEQYFLSVNVAYNVAPISLKEGSYEYIYGVNNSGELYQWNYGNDQYELYRPYMRADIGRVSDVGSMGILSVTARRAITNFNVKYVAVFYDQLGNVLAKVPQAQTEYRVWLDFIPDEPLTDVYSIGFELADGNSAYIQNALQVGYMK